ncbi:hypothetical protein Q9966_004018 [Columba livia]|nr:hypothetical protein Q9966_004018 [Columba livia]
MNGKMRLSTRFPQLECGLCFLAFENGREDAMETHYSWSGPRVPSTGDVGTASQRTALQHLPDVTAGLQPSVWCVDNTCSNLARNETSVSG